MQWKVKCENDFCPKVLVQTDQFPANRKRTAITLSIHPIKAVGWHNNTVAGMKLFINDGSKSSAY
ncbi:hypothetical protein T4E_2520 [Trichinella pseudospiralis]|uniref:Uncharacterized protein n=1 Tax=Trichinella pseudospiralis TaxID=6337 RepID=A0A0V1FQC7_TRIPS|nr:hypothetical protein T4E_2520 [Trichinella pseudospiralis]KRY88232.1 hypothetical protein T4D_6982 [Trichinella pseudospiralis]